MNNDDDFDPGAAQGAVESSLAIRRPEAGLDRVETQGEALAAHAAREAEVRYALARRFPREIHIIERRLLADCARPDFAASARYARPVGGDCKECDGVGRLDKGRGPSCSACLGTGKSHAHGFSIRFAEAAYAALGNLDVGSFVIYEDAATTRLRCYAIDLETNASWKSDVDIAKTVERKKLKKNQKAIGERQNSWGDTVYIVPAEPADHEKDCGAAQSKKLRDLILRLLPSDVKAACQAQVKATLTDDFRKQAATVVAKLVEAFGKLKPPISKDALAAYLGHPLEQMTTEESIDMRAIYIGVNEGHTTWATLLAEKRGDVEVAEGEKGTVATLRDKMAEKAQAKKDAAEKTKGGATETKAEPEKPAAEEKKVEPKAEEKPAAKQTEREPGSDG